MTILTDDLIEKAALAICKETVGWAGLAMFEADWAVNQKNYQDTARAALEAVLPDIVGTIADHIQKQADRCVGTEGTALDLAADDIRNLSPKQKD